MELREKAAGRVEIVALTGNVDASVSETLRRQLDRLISSGRTWLVLDLRDVGFIDSSGLSVLVGALKATRAVGGTLGLLKLRPTVRSVIELTRLDRILDVFSDEGEALERYSGGQLAGSGVN